MTPFHLGWFLVKGFSVQGWNEPGYGHGYDWTKPALYQDCARALERAFFDLLIIEDTSAVPDIYGGSMEVYLKHAASTPKLDPMVLVPYIAAVTKHIGIAPSMTSTFYPPYILARLLATLDHVTDGRMGWNIVTASSDRAAQNFGLDKQYEHDQRYDRADEYVDLVTALWNSWEPDAVVMDESSGTFADHTKVHRVDFEGKFYKSRGPLNVPHSPQGRPVFVAPGGSPRGRRFSGRNAEVVLAGGASVQHMKDYRDEVHAHAVAYGRDPRTCKTMFGVTPVITGSQAEAADYRKHAKIQTQEKLEVALAYMSYFSGIDFKKFDVDAPLPEITTNGMQTLLQLFKNAPPGATLRTIATELESYPIIGTADAVADEMGEMMDQIGGDGFLITAKFKPAYVASIVDQLVPALQRRGLTRTGYSHAQFRGNLFAF